MLNICIKDEISSLLNKLKEKNTKESDFLKTLITKANSSIQKIDELISQNKFENELKNYKGVVEVYFEPSDNSMTIVDNGLGFSKDELNHILKIDENSDFAPLFLVSNEISIISKKFGEDTAHKCMILDNQVSINPCINEEYSGTVIYIKFNNEFSKEFTNKELIKSHIEKFVNKINSELILSYFDENFEEKIERLN